MDREARMREKMKNKSVAMSTRYIWGIPLAVLLILIILLVVELNTKTTVTETRHQTAQSIRSGGEYIRATGVSTWNAVCRSKEGFSLEFQIGCAKCGNIGEVLHLLSELQLKSTCVVEQIR